MLLLNFYPFVADVFLVADCLVGFKDGHGTEGGGPVTKGLLPAPVVVPAHAPTLEGALVGATGALGGRTRLARPEGARQLAPGVSPGPVGWGALGPAARLFAVLLPAAVALLALLDDAVAAQRHLGLAEAAAHGAPGLGRQNLKFII